MDEVLIGDDDCDEECNWKFLGNWVDHNNNRVDNKKKNLVVYDLKQNFATDVMTINFYINPRYCGTESDVIDCFAEILFAIKFVVDNRVLTLGDRSDKLENI